jgi:tetratricopeptide (TPR) repeat protein
MRSSGVRKLIVYSLLGLLVAALGATTAFAQDTTETAAAQSYNLGIQAEQKGDTSEAITYYTAATTADPNYADAYYNLGSIYFAQNNLEKAAANFKKITEIKPGSADGFAAYGKVLYAQGKYDDALAAYQQALTNDSKYTEGHKELGKLYFKMATQSSKADERTSLYNESIGQLEKYVAESPDDAYSYYLMGMAYKRLKNNNKAIENLTKASQLDPNDFESIYSLAVTYQSMDRYSQAIDAFEKALKLKPKDYLAAYNLAIAIQSTDSENYDAIIAAYERFLDIARKNTDSRAKNLIPQVEALVKKLNEAKAASGG